MRTSPLNLLFFRLNSLSCPWCSKPFPSSVPFSGQAPAPQHLYFHEGPKTAPRIVGAAQGTIPALVPLATLLLISVYLCPCFSEPSGVLLCQALCSLGYQCEECRAWFSLLCQQQVCVHLSPAKPSLLAALSLLLIPVLGFILQPRWFQGVSCLLVNPCPALSCRNLPKQPGCDGKPLVGGSWVLPAAGTGTRSRTCAGAGGEVVQPYCAPGFLSVLLLRFVRCWL